MRRPPRVAGLALIGLGLACRPGPPRRGMIVYGAAVAVLLAAVVVAGAGGPLLWPAVALHVALAAALLATAGRAGGWARPPSSPGSRLGARRTGLTLRSANSSKKRLKSKN